MGTVQAQRLPLSALGKQSFNITGVVQGLQPHETLGRPYHELQRPSWLPAPTRFEVMDSSYLSKITKGRKWGVLDSIAKRVNRMCPHRQLL